MCLLLSQSFDDIQASNWSLCTDPRPRPRSSSLARWWKRPSMLSLRPGIGVRPRLWPLNLSPDLKSTSIMLTRSTLRRKERRRWDILIIWSFGQIKSWIPAFLYCLLSCFPICDCVSKVWHWLSTKFYNNYMHNFFSWTEIY